MREIKFRAWDSREAKMYSNPIVINDRFYTDEFHREIDMSNLDVGKQYLMQFTGLRDKNGKEIYEGDIVVESSTDIKGKPEVVDYMLNEWCEDGFYSGYLFWSGSNNYVVVGNIYENPELIK